MPATRLTLRQAVQQLNQSHPTVRIGLTEAANFGHQSAGIEVARRLIAEGYSGTLELVVPRSVRDRLAPLMASLPPQAKVAVIAPDEAKLSPVMLGVYGGLDSVYLGGRPLGVHPDANARINADLCLILQPLQWPVQRALARRDPEGQVQTQPLPLPAGAGFHYATYAPEQIPHDVDTALAHASRPELRRPLQRIVAAVQTGALELQLAYGLHWTANYQSTVDCLTHALTLCNRTVQKPTLLLAVLPTESKQDQLCLTRLDTSKPADAQLTRLLEQGGVGRLQCHSLPEPVFRSLVQLSTYAPMLEGANTTNYARMLGRAYLSCRTVNTSFDRIEGFDDICDRCLTVPHDLRMEEPAGIATLLTQARDKASKTSRYFQRLGEMLRLPSHDQIAIGLTAAVEALQSPASELQAHPVSAPSIAPAQRAEPLAVR